MKSTRGGDQGVINMIIQVGAKFIATGDNISVPRKVGDKIPNYRVVLSQVVELVWVPRVMQGAESF